MNTPSNPEPQKPRLPRQIPMETGAFVVLLCLFVFFSIKSPDFRSVDNLRLLSKQAAALILLSTGMTLVIATGGIDISVGSVLALCTMVLGSTAERMTTLSGLSGNPTLALWLACLIAVGTGALCGLVNGLLIARVKLPPIIVTLAMFAAARAATLLFNNGNSIFVNSFLSLNETIDLTNLLGLPLLFWVGLLSLAIGAVILKFTSFGRALLALGGNRTAARLSGMRTARTETWVYVLCGALAGLAGVLNTGLNATAASDSGRYLELQAITAVILGGTVITGGKATMVGTGLGVLTIGVLMSGVRLLYHQDEPGWFLVGIALLLAVEVQKWRSQIRN